MGVNFLQSVILLTFILANIQVDLIYKTMTVSRLRVYMHLQLYVVTIDFACKWRQSLHWVLTRAKKPAVVPLKEGEDNPKLGQNKVRKIQIYQYGQTKSFIRGS